MIISASRRTDIPAFYSKWFMERIRKGFVFVKNPMNPKQISQISLKPNVVDCFVFWTKNPRKMIPKLKILDELGYAYYFQFTLNPYNKEIEPNVPTKKTLINTFIDLSKKIGKKKVIWRYDPILLTDKISVNYHIKYFEYLASKLHRHTDKCVISFIDFYKKCQKNLKPVSPLSITHDAKYELTKAFKEIALNYDIAIETCAEDIELSSIGIKHGKCIDDKLIADLCSGEIKVKKDKNQREICGCVTSIDIGAYNTCKHGCLYCYANFNKNVVSENYGKHNPGSPLIFGEIGPQDKISIRKVKTIIDRQMDLI